MRSTRAAGRVVVVMVVMVMACLAPVHAHFGSCEDHTEKCSHLASLGLCETRRQFMLQNCPVSCDACIDPNCYDRSKGCTADAKRGLCQTQRNFMKRYCPHSCDVCRVGSLTEIGFTDIKTIINPDFECGKPYPAQAGRPKRQVIFPDELELIDTRAPPQAQNTNQPVVPLPPSPDIAAPSGPASIDVEETFCGATPITDRFLVTAAHCVFDQDRPVHTVRLGELDFASDNETNSRPVDYTVERIIVHPDYDPSSLVRYNDVALLQTVEKIQFNDLVYPFCIFDKPPAPGSRVIGAGFGLVNLTHRATVLQEAELEIMEASRCEDIYRQEQFLPQLKLRYPELLQEKSIFCASYPDRSACQGDSGGPLYMDMNDRRFLVGVVGSGVSCRSNSISILPGLYIDVADHIKFIDSVVYSPARF